MKDINSTFIKWRLAIILQFCAANSLVVWVFFFCLFVLNNGHSSNKKYEGCMTELDCCLMRLSSRISSGSFAGLNHLLFSSFLQIELLNVCCLFWWFSQRDVKNTLHLLLVRSFQFCRGMKPWNVWYINF